MPGVLFVNHFAIPPTRAGGTRHFTLAREMKAPGLRGRACVEALHAMRKLAERLVGVRGGR